MLRFFTKMTAVRSSKKLALSFNDMEPDSRTSGGSSSFNSAGSNCYSTGRRKLYSWIYGKFRFADSVEEFHTIYPEVPLRFFWDKADADEVTRLTKH